MDSTEAQLYVGQILSGRYRVEMFRGSGAFCGVFEGLDLTRQRPVAIKILSLKAAQDAPSVLEFHEEARLLDLLSGCSNIVGIFDKGQHTMAIQVTGSPISVPMNVAFMVLELATVSLADLIAQRHRVPWADRLDLYRDVVKGAHQMHLRKIVHRDLKAENILVFEQPTVAKIADLGRSKNIEEPPSQALQRYQAGRGDPRFMPPELLWLQGQPDPDAHLEEDIYLLGSVLFEFATGAGITAFALGDPRAVIGEAASHPERERAAVYQSRISNMRDRYDVAYATFFAELPASIAFEATALLRQLTDPEPQHRLPTRPFRGLPLAWDLQWLLRKVDILRKRLDVKERSPRFHRSRRRR